MEVHDDATYGVFYKTELDQLKADKRELVSMLEMVADLAGPIPSYNDVLKLIAKHKEKV
jgi:hypothetical protein